MTLDKITAAFIDVGSNTIKLLVAQSGARLKVLHQATLDTRISEGIGGTTPHLQEKSITEGAAAVQSLHRKTSPYNPAKVLVTATSAVRDADNGQKFIQAVKERTGLRLRVLSGCEEARYIALGAAQDPILSHLQRFQMADLGGGSLELIDFSNGQTQQTASLKLGAVRLMEIHVNDPGKPMPAAARDQIVNTVQNQISESGFRFEKGGTPLVGSGGAFTYTRSLLARKMGMELEEYPNKLPVKEIESLYRKLSAMTLAERCSLPGLPESRADIFPIALLTLLTLAKVAGQEYFLHTFYNLRFGLAAEFFAQQR